MLTSVDVLSVRGETLSLPLQDVVDGIVIQDITGLDPVKANVVTSSFATMDGEQFQSTRREKRNIVLTLGLEPDWTTGSVRQLRNQLYSFFMPKSQASLTFNSDEDATVYIEGMVESFESALFTQEPTVTISLLCFDPDFQDPNQVSLGGAAFTSVSTITDQIITYDGTVEAGIHFSLLVNRTLTNFFVINTPPDGNSRVMEFNGTYQAGDVIDFSTVPGGKYVNITRGNSTYTILHNLTPESDWIQLFPGDNAFRVSATGAGIPYTIDYYTRYGGL